MNTYCYFTERHLQAMWFEQKHFHLPEGVRIVSPGIWNAEAGPDFLKAQITLDDETLYGDVEIHLSEEDWYHHGHDRDPGYDDVVLHVVLWKPKTTTTTSTTKSNDEHIHTIYLEDFLTTPLANIVHRIDLDLYPYKKFIGSGKCAQSLFQSLSPEEIRPLFQSAAWRRLEEKNRFLCAWIDDDSSQLAGGIAMALGYKKNTQAFLELFLWLWELRKFQHFSEEELLAASMGSCGFFEEKFQQKWQDSPKYRQLHELWRILAPRVTHQAHLSLDHIRPLNHPIRRLAYLAKFLSDPECLRLQEKLNSLPLRTHRQIRYDIFALIPTYQDAYWNHHYTFETKTRSAFLPLMGSTLKKEILINAALPLLFERAKNNEIQILQNFYCSLAASKNSKTRYLTHRFFGDTNSPKGQLLKKAVSEQGAFQIHREFCMHHEASCEGCSFTDTATTTPKCKVFPQSV